MRVSCSQIVVEAFAALFMGVAGAAFKTPELKEISWASEMKTRCVLLAVLRKVCADTRAERPTSLTRVSHLWASATAARSCLVMLP